MPASTWGHAPERNRRVFKSGLRSFFSSSALSLVEKAAWKSGREYIAIWLVLFFYSRFIFFPQHCREGQLYAHRHVSAVSCPAGMPMSGKEAHSRVGWPSVLVYSCSRNPGCRLLPCSFSSKAAVASQWVTGLQGMWMRLTGSCAG